MNLRIIHRYLGFFLAGIMAVYALSGMIMIFRDTDFLKKEIHIEKTIGPDVPKEKLGQLLDLRRLKVDKEEGDLYYFREGTYNKVTGEAAYTVKELPVVVEKLTSFHKAKSGDPLFFMNIFFGLSLLFFVVSAFWMFVPSSSVFRKGLYFTLAGVVLMLVLLFV